jgi:predicted phage replisome organizer
MAEVKWIKLATDIFQDDKIRLIRSMKNGDELVLIWIALLCLAGRENNDGVFALNENEGYTPEMLAVLLDSPLARVKEALKAFKRFGMIDIDDDGVISITNWDTPQDDDSLEKTREQTRKRVAKHREKKALEGNQDKQCNVTDSVTVTQCNVTGNVTKGVTSNVTVTHKERETNKETEKEKERSKEKEKEKEINKEKETTPPISPPKRLSLLTKTQETRFSRFWEAYPRKVSKANAEKAWAKINPDDELTEKIISAIGTAKRLDERFRETRFTPHPASWLNARSWENEFTEGESYEQFIPSTGFKLRVI